MQIKSLFLYNKKGIIRKLPFHVGKVNIITGESKTGKTAIIDIINYCLGSDECKISEGVIRDNVEWFAILLAYEKEEIFIARQNPNSLNQSSTDRIYFANADKITIPDLSEIKNNSDITTLKDFFTKKLFISEFQNTPQKATRDPLSVNFKHSRFYCYQPQYLIAQPNYLFYNQSEPFVPQTIKDTLPYFLGAIREDFVKIEQEINSKRRELNRLERELKEYERLKDDGSVKIYELVDQGKQLGIIPIELIADNVNQALAALKIAQSWEETSEETPQGENENLKKLLAEKLSLEKELSRKTEDAIAVNTFISHSSEYSDEIIIQKARLESINLFQNNELELHKCPLCNQNIDLEIPSVIAINKSLQNLSENLANTLAEKPKLSQYIKNLDLELDTLKKQIQIRQNGIKAIYLENEEAGKQKDLNLRKGKVIGKISLFLESFSIVTEDKNLKKKMEALTKQIEKLEDLISVEEKDSKLSSILNQINTQMTIWKSLLDIEYEDPIRFDIRKLTLFVDRPSRSIPLVNIGGGANWVAYHLLIHFALHKHFVNAKRPVPRFIILDQPSQIYFPPDKDKNETGVMEISSDEKAVRQMYDFIFKVQKELSPNFQVIITDHAKLNYPEFSNSIIEEWRNGKKLIPLEWI